MRQLLYLAINFNFTIFSEHDLFWGEKEALHELIKKDNTSVYNQN